MSSKKKSVTETTEPTVVTDTALSFPNTDALTTEGVLDPRKVLEAYGYTADEFEIAAQPPPHYWVPEEGSVVFGVVTGEFTYKSTKAKDDNGENQPFTSFVLRLTKPAIGMSTESQELEQLEPGDILGFGKRAAVENLGEYLDKEVAILCEGKRQCKNDKKHSFWKMNVMVRKSGSPAAR